MRGLLEGLVLTGGPAGMVVWALARWNRRTPHPWHPDLTPPPAIDIDVRPPGILEVSLTSDTDHAGLV